MFSVCAITIGSVDMNKKFQEVYQFVLEEIASVPQLEALLLLWNERPKTWTVEKLANRLYVPVMEARYLLQDLEKRQLIKVVPGATEGYCYNSVSAAKDRLIGEVEVVYRKEVVQISTVIHSKPAVLLQKPVREERVIKGRD